LPTSVNDGTAETATNGAGKHETLAERTAAWEQRKKVGPSVGLFGFNYRSVV
jgi:hypothetical protein